MEHVAIFLVPVDDSASLEYPRLWIATRVEIVDDERLLLYNGRQQAQIQGLVKNDLLGTMGDGDAVQVKVKIMIFPRSAPPW